MDGNSYERNSSGDSEDERDLEIALYSQIHFDTEVDEVELTNTGSNQFWSHNAVGVNDIILPLRTDPASCTPSLKIEKHTILDDEEEHIPISFPKKKHKIRSESAVIEIGDHDNILKTDSNIHAVNKNSASNVNLPQFAYQNETTQFKYNDENECDFIVLDEYVSHSPEQDKHHDVHKKTVLQPIIIDDDDDVQEIKASDSFCIDKSKKKSFISSQSCRQSINNLTKSKHSYASSDILPFSITKPIVNVKKSQSCSVEVEDEEEITVPVKKSKVGPPVKPPISPAKDFLKLCDTTSYNNERAKKDARKLKKKKLSKQEVAIQRMKPPVIIRRAPMAKFNNRQDSDTDTEYSDSDTSQMSSPTKAVISEGLRSQSADGVRVTNDGDLSNKFTSLVSPSSQKDCVLVTPRLSDNVNVKVETYSKLSRHSSSSDSDSDLSDTKEALPDLDLHPSGTACLDNVPSTDRLFDFNLKGGVDNLLKSAPKTKDQCEKWQIGDQDRYKVLVTASRYFSPRSISCRNCNEEGHKAADCPAPKKSVCIYCGQMGHTYYKCPLSTCFNCDAPGHRSNDCTERKKSKHSTCDRCWMSGHLEEKCPDLWRQYHLTRECDNGKIQRALKDSTNPRVFCFNCSEEGHLGYECKRPTMNAYIIPNYPLVAQYDVKGKESKHGRRSDKMEKTSKLKRKIKDDSFTKRPKKMKKSHGKGAANEKDAPKKSRKNVPQEMGSSRSKNRQHQENRSSHHSVSSHHKQLSHTKNRKRDTDSHDGQIQNPRITFNNNQKSSSRRQVHVSSDAQQMTGKYDFDRSFKSGHHSDKSRYNMDTPQSTHLKNVHHNDTFRHSKDPPQKNRRAPKPPPKKKNKSGFEMKSQFQNLSKSFKNNSVYR